MRTALFWVIMQCEYW